MRPQRTREADMSKRPERLSYEADKDHGMGFDIAFTAYGASQSRVVVSVFGEFMEASRYLAPGELETLRDWINVAIAYRAALERQTP